MQKMKMSEKIGNRLITNYLEPDLDKMHLQPKP